MKWLCKKDKVKVIGLEYIPNPKDKFKYVLFHVTYEDDIARDTFNWFNDCMQSTNSLHATVVLTGWSIKYHKGYGVAIKADKDKNLEIKYIDKYNKSLKKDKIKYDNLPLYIKESIDIIFDELLQRYGEED